MSANTAEVTQRIAMKAVIANANGEVLLLRVADTDKAGGNAGKYGAPGGKLKPGEAWEEGLKREVKEETGLDIVVGRPLQVGEWRPVVQGRQLQIVAVFFACTSSTTEVKLSEENDAYAWVDLDSLGQIVRLEPDCTVVQNYLQGSYEKA